MPSNRPRPLRVLGIMTGTSIDSVDYALCKVGPDLVELLDHWQVRYPARLQQRLHVAARGEANCREVGQLHHDLGRLFAHHAGRGGRGTVPQLIGLHGQTVYHHPDLRRPATLQIGEPAYLTEQIGVPVVSNFRAADMAAGGQGAPLATLFHVEVFGRPGRHICVNNLGGISNVTSIDWRRGRRPRVLAFDTGPANVLIDLEVRRLTHGRRSCDRNGRLAAAGRPDETVLKDWLRHPYFKRRPPKSTGREEFGETFLARALRALRRHTPEDTVATVTELTARSIALNYARHLRSPPDEVILSGGGTRNPVLVSRIRANLSALHPSIAVTTTDSQGWPDQSIEAAAFALLAWRRWFGLPSTLPETTGARHATCGGSISLPRSGSS